MKGKILIIDDSITQATTLKFALVKAGFDVNVARDGLEGIAMAYQVFPDIIISDIIMPEINGYQLCRVLKNDNLTKRIPIILLTSLDEKIDRFWGIKAGADSFFVKSSNISKLTEEIKNFLATTSLLSESKRKRLVEKRKIESTNIKSRVNQLLDKSLIESTITNEFRNLSELIHDRMFLTKGLFSLLFSILDYQIAGIYFNDQAEDKRLISFSINEVETNDELLQEIKTDFFKVIDTQFSHDNNNFFEYEVFEEHTSENKIPIENINQFTSKIIIPIEYGKQVLGGFCLYNVGRHKYQDDDLINLVSEELILLLRLRSLYVETKILAITDGLTKLFNRRYFQEVFEREFKRAKRYKNHLSLIMIDLDHFKKLNDTYGHQLGDLVLVKLSAIIKKAYRNTDCVARYGGEEIIIVCPETSLENAAIPTRRMQEKIRNTIIEWGDHRIRVTVSIGIATMSADVTRDHELIKRADKVLYEAKRKGRDQVVLYESE